MTGRLVVAAVPLLLVLGGCMRLHAPEPFELGAQRIVGIAQPSLAAGVPVEQAELESWVRVRRVAEVGSAKGVCVLLPGILGSHSSPTCENRLHEDGWNLVVISPPLVSSVLRELRSTETDGMSDKGARVAQAVDEVVARAADVARGEIEALRAWDRSLAAKPSIVVGESLGALVGVGVVATGRVPCDAAILVAGGGSLLDVASESSLRRVLFGDLPIDDEEFRRGYREHARSDSLAAATRLHGAPVVCVTAAIDLIVPVATQEALWDALGRPPRYRFDGGHLELFVFAEWNILPVVREVALRAAAALPSES